MSDSKRSDAAQLAQELGSTGSWSEAFIPRSHGSVPASEVPHRYMTSDNQTFDDNAAMTQSELDPPPAYSRSSQVHELPANPVTTTTSVQPAHVLQDGIGNVSDANNGQEESEDGDGLNVQTPLLGGPRSAYLRGWTPWIWQGKTARRRRLRLLCLVILFGVLASILSVLACVFYNSSNAAGTWQDTLRRPSQSLVPTGPSYAEHKTTEGIRGTYKLVDRLELTTETGTIDVDIDLRPGNGPAVLLLSSRTGSVNLRVSSTYLHRKQKAYRPVYTEIRSVTGSVTADILLGHGSNALIDTTTGTQQLSIMAYDLSTSYEISNLTTYSRTGSQRVVLKPLDSAYDSITKLRAEHHSFLTASLDVQYPSLWLGEVHAEATLGRVDVTGQGLEYIKHGAREVVAHQGSLATLEVVQVICEGTGSSSFSC